MKKYNFNKLNNKNNEKKDNLGLFNCETQEERKETIKKYERQRKRLRKKLINRY